MIRPAPYEAARQAESRAIMALHPPFNVAGKVAPSDLPVAPDENGRLG